MSEDKAHVYVMKSGSYYKIGWAIDPKKRLKQLQTGNPREIRLIGTLECETRLLAKDLERHFQEHYPDKIIRGEWYDLSAIEIKQLLGMVRLI